jgi:hypothetical protein
VLEQPGVSHELLLEKTKLEGERQANIDALAPIQNKAPERALLTPAQKHSNLLNNHSVCLLQEFFLASIEEILRVCRSREVANGSYVPFYTFACDLARSTNVPPRIALDNLISESLPFFEGDVRTSMTERASC